MNAKLEFPGGSVARPRPTKEQLARSALDWLTLAQGDVSALAKLVEARALSAADVEPFSALATLQGRLTRIRSVLEEM